MILSESADIADILWTNEVCGLGTNIYMCNGP